MRRRRHSPRRRRAARVLTAGSLACLVVFLLTRLLTDRAVVAQWAWWVPQWVWPLGAVALVALSRGIDPRRQRSRPMTLFAAIGALAIVLGADWRAYRFVAEARSDTGAAPPASLLFLNLAAERIEDVSVLALPGADVYVIANASSATSLDALARNFDDAPFVAHSWPFVVVSRWPVTRLGATVFRPPDDPDARSEHDPGRAEAFVLEETPMGEVTLWVVDFPSDPRRSRVANARQAAESINAAARFPAPDLVVGDFNITRGSYSLRLFTRETAPGLRDAHAAAGRGPAGTWPRRAPLWPIDHAFLGPRLVPTGMRVHTPPLGTHRAIIIECAPSPDPAR
ncbi:MAG: endonuclease/exonuclease/phosphatase family protein [Phycisphaeraceae bacterium]|nr:endonuclease/exonuclease/phosphatase family protein [Phycisphaeraceae bacterium]